MKYEYLSKRLTDTYNQTITRYLPRDLIGQAINVHTYGYKTVCYSSGGGDGGRSLADVRRVIVPLLIGTHITPKLGTHLHQQTLHRDVFSSCLYQIGKKKKTSQSAYLIHAINKIRKSEK